jgi:insulysin
MTVVSQKFPGVWKQKEKWYGTEYTYEKIPADFLAEIRQAAKSTLKNRLTELHLPHENQFIPTKLEVEKKEIKEPALSRSLFETMSLFGPGSRRMINFGCPRLTCSSTAGIHCRMQQPRTA